MIPASPPDFHGSRGEERLHQALRTLPDDFIVIHSLRWIHPGNVRDLGTGIGAQGEGDFVVVDPARGILVVEVKGGEIWCAQGEWFQRNRNTGLTRRVNPEAQASNTLHCLRAQLLDRVPGTEGLVFGHAVWFPDGEVDCSRLPFNYNADMTFHQHHLAEPAAAVTRGFNYWAKVLGRRSRGLGRLQVERVVEVLAPSLSIVRSVRQGFDEREERLVQLTQEQAGVVRFLDEQLHAAIQGAAGTGKTLVAIEKARRLASPRQQVLFLCYNGALQQHLASNHAQANVEYLTFHGLTRRIIGHEGDLAQAEAAFLEYLADGRELPYDHLIVDEAQDFPALWLEFLQERFRRGAFYVFYDRHQTVQGDKDSGWMDEIPCRLVLTKNCRNTDQVAKLAYRAGMLPLSPALGLSGPRPVLHVVDDDKQALAVAAQLVEAACARHSLPPAEVAILPLAGAGEGGVWAIDTIAGRPTADRPTRGHVTVSTPRRFKGLEAAMVIVPGVDFRQATDLEWRRLLYVACSRARQSVHIITTSRPEDLRDAVKIFADTDRIRPSWQALCRVLGLRLSEGGEIDPFNEPRSG